jgi:DegV family protein with EDD domain
MKNFIVSTDSGCDLSSEICKEKEIFVLKMTVTVGEDAITDEMSVSQIKKIYEMMRKGATFSTSQINTGEYIDYWKDLLEKYNLPIVHITLASAISGSYNNAVRAAEIMKKDYPDAEIYVVDSTIACTGYGLLNIEAAKMRDEGKSAEECVKWLNDNRRHVHALFTTEDLKYLMKGGRVSRSKAVFGTLLHIMPILRVDYDGSLKAFEKARGRNATYDKLETLIAERIINPQGQVLYLSHSDFEDEAKVLGERLKKKFKFKDVCYNYIGPVIGAHTGPGLLTIFFLGKEREVQGKTE